MLAATDNPLSVEQPELFACYQAAAAGVTVSGERGGIVRIVTPDTLLRWYRNFVARKYDGSQRRGRAPRPLPSRNGLKPKEAPPCTTF